MTIKLAPYQTTAARIMSSARRFLLADAPGVGKTYPAIAAARSIPGRKLVICPAHLRHQWVLCLEVMGERAGTLGGSTEWLVVSFHALGAKTASGSWRYPHLQTGFRVTIIDEAHTLRNPKSNWTRAALKIDSRVFMLTGTPEISHAGNLYVLAAMLKKISHRSYWKFVDEHCDSSLGHFGRKIGGLRDPRAFHKEIFSPDVYLRRELHDSSIGLNISDPVMHDVHLVLDGNAQKIHQRAKIDYRDENHEPIFDAGKLSHYLRQIASWPPVGANPKMALVRSVLENHPGERIVILCWYRKIRDNVYNELCSSGTRRLVRIRAEDTRAEQSSNLESFKLCQGSVLVGTLPHLKEGIDGLQCASVLILYERSWLNAENEQAIARFVRRGQCKVVHVYRPVVDKTFDAAVAKASNERQHRTLRDLLGEF